MNKRRTSRAIADEDYAAVLGKVFVHTTSYSVEAYQIVGRTKCYVRAVRVPLVSTRVAAHGDGTHRIDWTSVAQPAPGSNSAKGDLYTLMRDDDSGSDDEQGQTDEPRVPVYSITKAKADFHAFPVERGSDHVFTTVGY